MERKYLRNPCHACGQEQIGSHYHEPKEDDDTPKPKPKPKGFTEKMKEKTGWITRTLIDRKSSKKKKMRRIS